MRRTVAIRSGARRSRPQPRRSRRRKPITQPLSAKSHSCPEPAASARAAGLHYVTDEQPGIRRERFGGAFRYRDSNGRLVREKETLKRIKALVIPPAWSDVWICASPTGHLQATGRDARGRKQYRYHGRWRAIRDETKYTRLLQFARALPAIRRVTAQHLALPGLPREKVLAAVVRLLERTLIRVGNDEYAACNRSYGLTTMQDKHAAINGKRVEFQFRGKGGKQHRITLDSPRLARIVRRCRELPGAELFQYVDDKGGVHDIGSADVNAYVREITGCDFTAKDFRTWFGTVLACVALREVGTFHSETHAKKNVSKAVEAVAESLGNTLAVCRKAYVHPAVVEAYMARTFADGFKRPRLIAKPLNGLGADELAAVNLLQQAAATHGRVRKKRRQSRPRRAG